MNNLNDEPSGESIEDDRSTGWEEVADLADKMNSEEQMGETPKDEGGVDKEQSVQRMRLMNKLRERARRASEGYEIRNTGGDSKNGGVVIEARKGLFGRKIGAGVLDADLNDEEAAVLNAVHVKPRYRGRGVGSAITREAVAQARREGLKRVKLNSTDMAIEMYKRQGFETTDESSGAMVLDLDKEDEEKE
ncbi:GNAT family N-acetyltransferase [Candidatus Saccharibacteria bacterium]|nr:GNAT family N-acetyltransferase [Candidatus Saccharibacteria bacterium]